MSEQAALARAQALLEVGRATEAIVILSTAVAETPQSYPLLCELSLAYLRARQSQWAKEVAERAIAVSPDRARAFRLESAARGELGDPAGATRAADEAVRLEPLHWLNHVQLSLALSRFQPETALADEGSIEKKARRVRRLRLASLGLVVLSALVPTAVGVGMVTSGHGADALVTAAKALALMTWVLLIALLLFLFSIRDRRAVDQALAEFGGVDLADIAGEPPARRALSAAQRAVSLAPDQPDAHFALGYAAQRLKKRRVAAAAYRRTLALKPDHAMAMNNLSGLQMRIGRMLTAARGLRNAASIRPDMRIAEYNLKVLAARFIRWFNLGVLLVYLLMQVATPQSEGWVAAVACVGLAVLVVAAVALDLGLPPALRTYYRRLALRDSLFGLRVALLIAAFVLTICELLPLSPSAYSAVHAGVWICLLGGVGLALAHGVRLKSERAALPGS